MNIKLLNKQAVLPKRAHESDAGYDLTATSRQDDSERGIITYGTGIAMQIPSGCVGLLFPRSSVYKTGLQLVNSVGVIDPGYAGEVMFKYRIVDDSLNHYKPGDRIGQLVIVPIHTPELKIVDELDASERGSGGFGSTGN
jgi:dUTP pyrophosphatase